MLIFTQQVQYINAQKQKVMLDFTTEVNRVWGFLMCWKIFKVFSDLALPISEVLLGTRHALIFALCSAHSVASFSQTQERHTALNTV